MRNQAALLGVGAADVDAVRDMDWWLQAPSSGLIVWEDVRADLAARGPGAATTETGRAAKGARVMVAQPGGLRKRADVDRSR
jgi:hypothetical protein